jgi:hypothetical protein
LAPDLRQYVVFKVSPSSNPTHPQAPPFDIRSIIVDPHMAIILMHVGKNLVEDVMLDEGSGVNIITEDLKKKMITYPKTYTLHP